MILAILSLGSAAGVARFYRKSGKWLRMHRLLAVAGCISAWLGFVLAFIMREMHGGEHFRIFHAYLGIIALILVSWTPAVGYALLRRVRARTRVAMLHRWSGRGTAAICLLAIITGLLRALAP